jgi:hypothetical protein
MSGEDIDDESRMTPTTWGCKTKVLLMPKVGSLTADAAQDENVAGTYCLIES